jgi:hypothetical protein
MFRAALFSIVLTLAVGQNAGLLCKVWCSPHEAASAGCRHQAPVTSPSVTGNDNCTTVAVGTAEFLREEARRAGSASDCQNAVVVPRFGFTPSSADSRSRYERWQQRPLEAQPLVTALRI